MLNVSNSSLTEWGQMSNMSSFHYEDINTAWTMEVKPSPDGGTSFVQTAPVINYLKLSCEVLSPWVMFLLLLFCGCGFMCLLLFLLSSRLATFHICPQPPALFLKPKEPHEKKKKWEQTLLFLRESRRQQSYTWK